MQYVQLKQTLNELHVSFVMLFWQLIAQKIPELQKNTVKLDYCITKQKKKGSILIRCKSYSVYFKNFILWFKDLGIEINFAVSVYSV